MLALAYFAEVGLPRSLETIPLEYFDKAIAWVKQRPEVDATKIGAMGGSRGSEAVLLMASRNKDVKAVLAYAPSGVTWGASILAEPAGPAAAWTGAAKPLPHLSARLLHLPAASSRHRASTCRALAKAEAAQIAIEAVNGPILLISGGDDQLWPSTVMADQMAARLKASGFSTASSAISYPVAGHMVFAGDIGRPASTGRVARRRLCSRRHAWKPTSRRGPTTGRRR